MKQLECLLKFPYGTKDLISRMELLVNLEHLYCYANKNPLESEDFFRGIEMVIDCIRKFPRASYLSENGTNDD